MVSNGALLKRISQLERTIRFKRPRIITIVVDAHSDDRTAEDAILQELAVVDADLVVRIQDFCGKDPELPRLHSVIQMV
jgi:hypothetical protein